MLFDVIYRTWIHTIITTLVWRQQPRCMQQFIGIKWNKPGMSLRAERTVKPSKTIRPLHNSYRQLCVRGLWNIQVHTRRETHTITYICVREKTKGSILFFFSLFLSTRRCLFALQSNADSQTESIMPSVCSSISFSLSHCHHLLRMGMPKHPLSNQ